MDPVYYNASGGMIGLPTTAADIQIPSNGPPPAIGNVLQEPMLNGYENIPLSLDSQNLDDDDDELIQRPFSRTTDPPTLSHQNSDEIAPDQINKSAQASINHAGAGPLPTDFGTHPIPSTGSTLTEFTKRRNWSQRVVEELQDFLHILTPDGRFVYVSPNAKALTGYEPSELLGKFIVDFIHQDDSAIFVLEFNESIASGNPLRFFYRFKKSDGTYAIFESHGHPHLTTEAAAYGPTNAAGFCRGFFMMARPYPTKNAALLDSFLEHKIENQRLMRRIADLKREEAEEENELDRAWTAGGKAIGTSGRSEITPSTEDTEQQAPNTNPSSDKLAMPPPAKPPQTPAGNATNLLTRQNLEDATALARPDSINDKMARYEGATHIETIEMLTGLRYQDGERSQGISTGDSSPALIRGDAGIAIPVDKDRNAGQNGANGLEKKKKGRVVDEYVCTDCGTLDSPEWRKGPSGPKTLCNACGLRWAKREKKKSVSGPSGNSHNHHMPHSQSHSHNLNHGHGHGHSHNHNPPQLPLGVSTGSS